MNPDHSLFKNAFDTVEISKAAMPVFFFHKGHEQPLFFDKVLEQAAKTNGNENIYVLADSNFHLYHNVNYIDITEYTSGAKAFDKVYKHHSALNPFFEKACFDRWFIINDIVKDLKIDHFFHADSDLVILEDLKPVYEKFIKNKFDGSMMFFENGAGNSITSGHASFWNSKLINDLCNFILEKYSNEQELDALVKDTISGKFYDNTNVSDMILLDVFRTETKPNTLALLSLEENNICFDFNLSASFNGCKSNFIMGGFSKLKKIRRRKGGWYGQNKGGNREFYKFYTLHFQGYLAKGLIPAYVSSGNFYRSVQNYTTAEKVFLTRKFQIFKNTMRDKVYRLIGKK